jgi:hypothetical protein
MVEPALLKPASARQTALASATSNVACNTPTFPNRRQSTQKQSGKGARSVQPDGQRPRDDLRPRQAIPAKIPSHRAPSGHAEPVALFCAAVSQARAERPVQVSYELQTVSCASSVDDAATTRGCRMCRSEVPPTYPLHLLLAPNRALRTTCALPARHAPDRRTMQDTARPPAFPLMLLAAEPRSGSASSTASRARS